MCKEERGVVRGQKKAINTNSIFLVAALLEGGYASLNLSTRILHSCSDAEAQLASFFGHSVDTDFRNVVENLAFTGLERQFAGFQVLALGANRETASRDLTSVNDHTHTKSYTTEIQRDPPSSQRDGDRT